MEAAQESGKPIMIYFNQPDCAWCAKTEQILAKSEVRLKLVQNYHFVNINIAGSDDAGVNRLKKMFKVRGTPAFAFLSPHGEPICMVYGNVRDEEELALIDSTVQALSHGAKPTLVHHGFPSCRGKMSEDDNLITGRP